MGSSGAGNQNDEAVSDGGSINEGSSSLSAKKALQYVKILCFLSFLLILIFTEGGLFRVIKSQRVEPVESEARVQLWSSMFGNLYNSIIWLGPVEANCCDSYKVDDSDESALTRWAMATIISFQASRILLLMALPLARRRFLRKLKTSHLQFLSFPLPSRKTADANSCGRDGEELGSAEKPKGEPTSRRTRGFMYVVTTICL